MRAGPGSRVPWAAGWASALAAALLAACGGGGGDSGTTGAAAAAPAAQSVVAGANVLPVTVDGGAGGQAFNAPFVTVRVCEPGTGTCQDIDRVLVDTGSSGLRIAASALSTPLRNALPAVSTAGGAAAGECAQFASGYAWGSVRRADVRLGGETAAAVPVQLVNDPGGAFSAVPAPCAATGANIGTGPGANGILGVGLFDQDCGTACTFTTAPGVYYGCAAGAGCTAATLPLASQVANPVARLPVNNNGVVLVLPPVPLGGASSVSGSLVLGIGTQANNQLGTATVYTTNAQGFFTTVHQGVTYPDSFLDSGSNGLFFRDAALSQCGDFYCPSPPVTRTATQVGANGATGTVTFQVDDVTALAPGATAAHLAGDFGSTRSFDWGLPFFFGRTVFVARAGAATPYGPGPWWGY